MKYHSHIRAYHDSVVIDTTKSKGNPLIGFIPFAWYPKVSIIPYPPYMVHSVAFLT